MNFAKSGSDPINVLWRIDQWFQDLTPAMRVGLKRYHEELLKFNRTLNLISVKTVPMADAIHFADCILASRVITKDLKTNEIFDLASGNGFPGLVIALLNPNLKVHLVDMDPKKAEFLNHMTSVLELKNVSVLIQSIESLPAGSVKAGVARGFAPLSKAMLVARKQFPIGASFYHMKGEEWATEIADIPTQLCSFWSPSLVGDYRLPVGEIKFAVVKTEKIQE